MNDGDDDDDDDDDDDGDDDNLFHHPFHKIVSYDWIGIFEIMKNIT